jgi:hypothetical protein
MALFPRRRPDLSGAWDTLEKVLADPQRDLAALEAAMHAFGPALEKATPSQRNEVLLLMTARVREWPMSRASIAALGAGALVEAGASPEPLHAAILERLPALFADAARFASLVAGTVEEEEDEEPDEDADELWLGRRRVTQGVLDEIREGDPDAAWAWFALDHFCSAAIAAVGDDPGRLRDLRRFGPELDALAEVNAAASTLRDVRDTMVGERVVLVDGASGRVFELEVGHVGSNFDLHEGASAALASSLGHRGVPGTGTWNVYDWRAVAHDVTRPADVPRERWVWNEGRPAEIPKFEGVRVLVVGPPSYERTWNAGTAGRSVRLRRELTAAEAAALLQRLGVAAGEMEA